MFLISDFFQPFCIFPHKNNTKHDDFNTVTKVRARATIIVLWEIWPKKGSAYLERDNDTDRLQKSVYIYTFVFTGTYTGPFCHNQVESRPIPLDFSSLLLELWGIKKYSCSEVINEGISKLQPFMEVLSSFSSFVQLTNTPGSGNVYPPSVGYVVWLIIFSGLVSTAARTSLQMVIAGGSSVLNISKN